MARKTKEEALATRGQLLDAAVQVFSEQGVAHSSLNEVACAAGLTRGAVYWHFENKADLLSALWERAALPMEQSFEELDQLHANDPLRRIREKAIAVIRRAVEDPQARAMLNILVLKCEWVDDMADARRHFLSDRDVCLARTAAEFDAAIQAGQLRAGLDSKMAAQGLFGLIDGLTMHWLFDTERFSLEVHAPLWVDAYLKGLSIP